MTSNDIYNGHFANKPQNSLHKNASSLLSPVTQFSTNTLNLLQQLTNNSIAMATTFYFEEVTDEEEAEIETETTCSNDHNEKVLPLPALALHQLPPCPHPIGGEASLTLIRNKAYIFGGCSREGVPSNILSCFDFGE